MGSLSRRKLISKLFGQRPDKPKTQVFTLIEIMVCLFLLSMVGAGVIYRGWRMLKEHRFSTSCERVASEIALTKSIALAYQIDIDLVLEQKGAQVYLSRKTDFPPEGIRELFRMPVTLPELAFKEKDGAEEFHFYGNGWIEGEEKVTFFVPKDLKKRYSVSIKRTAI